MKKRIIWLFSLACAPLLVQAQVARKVIVEHFTNTNCSVCASRNPGFYSNLNANADVLHIAIHPSAPYSACLLSKQSQPASDSRTNYYGVYGSTPRLVIQGQVIATSADYSKAALFQPYKGATSPFAIAIRQKKTISDSVYVRIVVRAVSTHTEDVVKLVVALAEDTVFYSSPNGEQRHYDVFRKALTDVTGLSIQAPASGDSVVYEFATASDPLWNSRRIYTIVMLQDAGSKEVLQAEAVPAAEGDHHLGMEKMYHENIRVYPNPANDVLHVTAPEGITVKASLVSSEGKPVASQLFYRHCTFVLADMAPGLYYLRTETDERISVRLIFVQ